MCGDKRRFFVYGLLFSFMFVNFLDRVSISLAGRSIATEMNLSPIQLGYLFSSFLWIYIFCILPAGAVTDRFGTRRTVAVAAGLWSVCQALGGLAVGTTSLLFTRLGLGMFESPTSPAANRVIREWAPRQERGLATAIWTAGALGGPAVGAPIVGWLITDFGWRLSFVATGLLGLIFVAIWLLFFHQPEGAFWLGDVERSSILRERNNKPTSVESPSIGYRGLARSYRMWGLAFTQGCLTYTNYFFLTWLPGYLQAARGLTIMQSGFYTALPFACAVVFSILLSHLCDRTLKATPLGAGRRRFAVALASLLSATILCAPFADSRVLIMVFLIISVTFNSCALTWNFALANDLLAASGDAGRATACLLLGGNSFGILAPIITGYLVSSTGNFGAAFAVCGVLAVLGAVVCLTTARGTLGPSETGPISLTQRSVS